MSEQEELIFGLYRYINKASRYLGEKNVEEFIRDEKSFDATCFCFYMIDMIIKMIFKQPELINKYPEIDFNKINKYKELIFVNDGIAYTDMYDIILNEFPLLQFKLKTIVEAFKYGKQWNYF